MIKLEEVLKNIEPINKERMKKKRKRVEFPFKNTERAWET